MAFDRLLDEALVAGTAPLDTTVPPASTAANLVVAPVMNVENQKRTVLVLEMFGDAGSHSASIRIYLFFKGEGWAQVETLIELANTKTDKLDGDARVVREIQVEGASGLTAVVELISAGIATKVSCRAYRGGG